MNMTEQLARAVLSCDSLTARSVLQDLLRAEPRVAAWPPPETSEPLVVAGAAALADLCAYRQSQPAPAWAAEVAPAPEPVFPVKAAASMKRLAALCETQSPEPLRRRRFCTPPNFLEFA